MGAHRRFLRFAAPDFLLNLVALAKFLRLSLRKAAYVAFFGFARQEIRVRFGRDDNSTIACLGMRDDGSAFGFSPVVDGVSDGGGGQVAAAHFVFGNAAEGLGYGLLREGIRLFDGFA
jgi:hypothetical protein